MIESSQLTIYKAHFFDFHLWIWYFESLEKHINFFYKEELNLHNTWESCWRISVDEPYTDKAWSDYFENSFNFKR